MSKLGTLYYYVEVDRASINKAEKDLMSFTNLLGDVQQRFGTTKTDYLRKEFNDFSEVLDSNIKLLNHLISSLTRLEPIAYGAERAMRAMNEAAATTSTQVQTTQFQDLRLAASALVNEFAILKNNAAGLPLAEVNAQMASLAQRGEALRTSVSGLATNFTNTSQEGVFLSGVMRDLTTVLSGVRTMDTQQTFGTMDRSIRESALSVTHLTNEMNDLFARLRTLGTGQAANELNNTRTAIITLLAQVEALRAQYAGQSEATAKLTGLQAQLQIALKRTSEQLSSVAGRDAKAAFDSVAASAQNLKARASTIFASNDLSRIASYRSELKGLEASLKATIPLFGANSKEAVALGKQLAGVEKILRNLQVKEDRIRLAPVAKQLDTLINRASQLKSAFDSANRSMSTMSPTQYSDALTRVDREQRKLNSDIQAFLVSGSLTEAQMTRLGAAGSKTAKVGKDLSIAFGDLNAKLPGLDGRFFEIDTAIKTVNARVSAASGHIRAFGDANGEQANKLRNLVNQAKELIATLEKYRSATKDSAISTKALDEAIARASRSAAMAQLALNRATGAHNSMTLAQQLARGATTELTNALFRLSPSLGIFTQNLSYTSGNLLAFVRAAAPLVAVAGTIIGVVATLRASINAARELETAMAKVRKTTNMTNDELEVMTRRFQTLAKVIPASTLEMAGYAAIAGQLGITGVHNVTMFAEAIAKLSIATNVVGEQSAQNLAQFLGALGIGTKEMGLAAERTGNVLNELENTTASSAGEILRMTQYTQGLSAQADLTIYEILGLNASLISLGLSAEAGGSAVVRIFAKMQTASVENNSEFREFARVAGMTSDEFKVLVRESPIEALTALSSGMGKAKEAGEDLNTIITQLGVNEVRERRTLLSLANGYEVLANAVETARREYFEMSSLTREVEVMSTTLDGKLSMLGNRFETIKQQIGAELLEPTKALVDGLIAIMDNFAMVAVALGTGLAIVGIPLLLVVGGIGGVVAGIGLLVTGLGLMGAAFLSARNAARPMPYDFEKLNQALADHGTIAKEIASKKDLEAYLKGIGDRLTGETKTAWEQFASVTLQNTTDSFESVKAAAAAAFTEISRVETAAARLSLVTGAQRLGGRIESLTGGLRDLGVESGGLLGGFAAVSNMLSDTMDVSQVTAFSNEMDALIARLDAMIGDDTGRTIFTSMREEAVAAKGTADELITTLRALSTVTQDIATGAPAPRGGGGGGEAGAEGDKIKNPVQEIMQNLQRSRSELAELYNELGRITAQEYHDGMFEATRDATNELIRVYTDPFQSAAFRNEARTAFNRLIPDLGTLESNFDEATMRALAGGVTDAIRLAEYQLSQLGQHADFSSLISLAETAKDSIAAMITPESTVAQITLARQLYGEVDQWLMRLKNAAGQVDVINLLDALQGTLADIDVRRLLDDTYSLADASRDQASAYRQLIDAAIEKGRLSENEMILTTEQIAEYVRLEQAALQVAEREEAIAEAYAVANAERVTTINNTGKLITTEQALRENMDTELQLLIALAEQLGWNNEQVRAQEEAYIDSQDALINYLGTVDESARAAEEAALLTRSQADESQRLIDIIARGETTIEGIAAAFGRVGKELTPELLDALAKRFNTTSDAVERLVSGTDDFNQLSVTLAAQLRAKLITEADVLRQKIDWLNQQLAFLYENFDGNETTIAATTALLADLKNQLDELVGGPLDAAAKTYSDAISSIEERTNAGLITPLEAASAAVNAKKQEIESLVAQLVILKNAEGDNTAAINDYTTAIEAARVALAKLTQEELRRRLVQARESTAQAETQTQIEVDQGLMTAEERLSALLRMRNDELRVALMLTGEGRDEAVQSARESIAALEAQQRALRTVNSAIEERTRREMEYAMVRDGAITEETRLSNQLARRTSIINQLYERQAAGETGLQPLIDYNLRLRERETAQLEQLTKERKFADAQLENLNKTQLEATQVANGTLEAQDALTAQINRTIGLVELATIAFGEESDEVKNLIILLGLLREEYNKLPSMREQEYKRASEAAKNVKPVDLDTSRLLGMNQADLAALFEQDITLLENQLSAAISAFGEGSQEAADAALQLTAKETELANAKGALAKLWWAQVDESNTFLQNLVGTVTSAAIAQSSVASSVMSGIKLARDEEGNLTGGLQFDFTQMLLAALMKILEGSEAFADIMGMLDGLLDPIITMVDALLNALKPIIAVVIQLMTAALMPLVSIIESVVAPALAFISNIVKNVWNAIVRFLKRINIFGWQPFKNLKEIGEEDNGEGLIERQERLLSEAREAQRKARTEEEIKRYQEEIDRIEDELARLRGEDKKQRESKGTRVSEITGPTRDLLLDLFRPLSILPSWTELFRDIRNDVRAIASGGIVPELPTAGFGVAGAAAASGPLSSGGVVYNFNNVSISTNASNVRDLAREIGRVANVDRRGGK